MSSTLTPEKSPPAHKVRLGYRPTPPQTAFHSSPAFIRGYGGAMGGGKSRAICEEAFRLAIKHPGLKVLICRQAHTSIVETTKKTMTEQVLPAELQDPANGFRKKESGGEDWLQLGNGSRFHFIGLEDPVRWFSSEVGLLAFDEAHEISEDTVQRLISRLRQRCPDCQEYGRTDCEHMPNRVMIAFNPENPGHWLQRWLITGSGRTQYGFYKRQLYVTGGDDPLGDCEFIFARAVDNPYLSDRYIQTLKGMRGELRRRYLEGEWVHVSGTCYFDLDALTAYQARLTQPTVVGHTACCKDMPTCGCGPVGGQPRLTPRKGGPWSIWKTPIRARYNPHTGRQEEAHRYIVAVDVSSGGSTDYSGIQVIDIENYEQAARYQGKTDPDLVAVEAARIGRIYNDALIAPEITGGWGYSIVKELQRLKYRRLYTRKVIDRLSDQWTDRVGWDTTTKTRALMLDTLERVLREQEFGLYDELTYAELGTFVRDQAGRPAAQPGCNDDLVMALAIAVTIAAQTPRQLRRLRQPEHVPELVTGW